ncbi:hypothetical protein HRR94_000046 [Exophiala dermatitidis]|nr:hypothetical protein HRR82_001036 [Exophiala dermatitidis]KAJ9004325.1 hypothetical protein HRR94_000046 [Exophiala dermatitidis]
MSVDGLQTALDVLKSSGVATVVVGELVLNYYNIPCILHDIEICIPSSQFRAAELALSSSPLFERLPPRTPDLYTKYKYDCPRFLYAKQHQTPIVLLSDLGIGFRKSEVLEIEEIKRIPMPTLPSFVQYLCLLFFRDGDDMYQIRLEQLVDGMNIDEEWCRKTVSDEGQLQYLLKLVNSKVDRIDDFSGNLVTCYIADQQMAANVTRIPGFSRTDATVPT